jgi:hypothetical protein
MWRLICVAAAGFFLLLELAPVVGGEGVAPVPPAAPVVSCNPAGPPPVAWWAVPGRTPADQGGYVGGGGGVLRGEPRASDEGTWGWDYQGSLGLHRIWLSWNHGWRYQGGRGAYRTDGHPVYNIFASPPLPEKHAGDH